MFLISNCLTVIEVLVNFGTEPGPACWEVCHCEGWSNSWCTYAIFFFFSVREWIVTVKVWNQYCFCIFHSTKHYFMVKWRKAHHRLGTSLERHSCEQPHDKTNKMTSAQMEDADQPGHLPSLISLRCPHEESCAFSYPLSVQSSLGAQVILLVARKTLK